MAPSDRNATEYTLIARCPDCGERVYIEPLARMNPRCADCIFN